MADYTQTLAQLLASNKQANVSQINNPSVSQLGWANGTQNQGYGQIGEAFGKGVGDYVKDTVVQAKKNEYMIENDPIEIEKRAEKFYQVYNNLDEKEQNQVDKWLNEDPQGLKWLDKLNKYASYMMTKVPLPEGTILKPGQANDDVQWYRPLRTLDSAEKMKSKALAAMPEAQRNPLVLADEKLKLEQAIGEPTRVAATKAQGEASTINANANALQAKTQAAESPGVIALNKAREWRLMHPVVNTQPIGLKVSMELYKQQQAQLGEVSKNYRALVAKVNSATGAPEIKERELNAAGIDYASQVSALDPLNPSGVDTYSSIATKLANRKNIDRPLAREADATLAKTLLDTWKHQIYGVKSLQAYYDACRKLKWKYQNEFYGADTSPEARKELYLKDMNQLVDPKTRTFRPEIYFLVKQEEDKLKEQKDQLFKYTETLTMPGGE
jgi:hypothetical protein